MQQVICDVPFRDEFIVRWRFQLRKNHSAVSTFVPRGEKTLVEKGSRRRGQRKARLSEGQPTLVTLFHLFPVGAKKKRNFRAYPSILKIRGNQRQLSENICSEDDTETI